MKRPDESGSTAAKRDAKNAHIIDFDHATSQEQRSHVAMCVAPKVNQMVPYFHSPDIHSLH